MIYLDVEDLVQLADLAVGGTALVRDLGLISSAAARPGSGFGDFEAYPTVHAKVAALLHSLVNHHALVDGNKRLGWVTAVVLYDLNGWTLEAPDDQAYDLVIAIAENEREIEAIASELEAWAQEQPH